VLRSRRATKATNGLARFSEADLELQETLDNLDGAANYAVWIYALMEPHLGSAVLEVGAGHGTFTDLLAESKARIVTSDLSERCVAILRSRFAGTSNVEILHGSIDSAGSYGPFDTAVLINVLEHIEDDNAALEELYELLEPGGRLLLWVPAFPILYSEFDRKIGHYRRYRLKGLGIQLARAGFEVQDIRYVNSVGAIAWLVVARLLRRTPTGGASVRIFDRYFVPVIRLAERRLRPPFGQSVLAVAYVPPVNRGAARSDIRDKVDGLDD
jgi:SAM-dependent methyltransferase